MVKVYALWCDKGVLGKRFLSLHSTKRLELLNEKRHFFTEEAVQGGDIQGSTAFVLWEDRQDYIHMLIKGVYATKDALLKGLQDILKEKHREYLAYKDVWDSLDSLVEAVDKNPSARQVYYYKETSVQSPEPAKVLVLLLEDEGDQEFSRFLGVGRNQDDLLKILQEYIKGDDNAKEYAPWWNNLDALIDVFNSKNRDIEISYVEVDL